MQAFYHVFWRRFCQELMAEWIAYPTNEAEAKTSLGTHSLSLNTLWGLYDHTLHTLIDTYRRLGMPGAVGSTDCTHVHWARCPIMKQSTHVGKEKYATLSYEVTCGIATYTRFPSPSSSPSTERNLLSLTLSGRGGVFGPYGAKSWGSNFQLIRTFDHEAKKWFYTSRLVEHAL